MKTDNKRLQSWQVELFTALVETKNEGKYKISSNSNASIVMIIPLSKTADFPI